MSTETALLIVALLAIAVNYRRGVWKLRTKELRKVADEQSRVIAIYRADVEEQQAEIDRRLEARGLASRRRTDDILEADIIQ